MEKEGFTLLWIGLSESDVELQKYVTLVYTDDGERLPSQFLQLMKESISLFRDRFGIT